MSRIWVNAQDYVGWCRRQVARGKRFIERRRASTSADPPALATLLRQLRVTDLTYCDKAAQQQYRIRLAAAASLAREAGHLACSQELERLRATLDSATDLVSLAAPAQESLVRAAAHLP